MAIVKMAYFELFTFSKYREELLKSLQKFSLVDLVDLKEKLKDKNKEKTESVKTPEELSILNEDLEKVKNAINLLRPFDGRPAGLKGMVIGNPNMTYQEMEERGRKLDYKGILDEIKGVTSILDDLSLKETKVRAELEELSPWTDLDINPLDLNKLKDVEGFFIQVPKKNEVTLYPVINKLKMTYIDKVGETKNEFIYLVITHPSEKEELLEGLKENSYAQVRVDFNDKPSNIRKRLNEEIISIKKEEKQEREKLATYAPKLPQLELAYEYLENKKTRILANEKSLKTEYLSGFSGYVPENKKEEFEAVVKETLKGEYSLSFKEAERDDPEVPVLLKNGKFAQAFESVTNMYSTPKYNEIDPTPFLAPFYTFFFGMMIGDAVYGLILFILTLIALKKFNLSKSMKSFIQFFHYLSYTTIFWGVIYGSYLSLDLPVPKFIDAANEIQKLLLISIGFGIVHLFFGLALKAYVLIRDGKPMDAIYDVLLWYMTLTGSALTILGPSLGLAPIAISIAKWSMIIGMVGIVLFAARDAVGFGGRIAGGLYSLYGISSWVGDVVSYSRLMALGLSGAFIGMAFNMIANMVNTAWYMIPFAIVIFLVGHVFNIFLSILGSYVHTLRLMYVEFFGKFYEGGGRKFINFRSEPKYINYTDEKAI